MKIVPATLAALTAMLMLAACGKAAPAGDTAMAAEPKTPPVAARAGPIVVELFQSQGCSSCPPANAQFNAVAGRKDLIALSFSVTYWDQLGWKDRFARPEFTQRQRDYAATLPVGAGVYTPQVVINGSRGLVGVRSGEIAGAIAAAKPLTGGPAVDAAKGRVTIGAGRGAATVWLARYDPAERRVPINAGENSGRTLPHRNIVRELVRLGDWTGGRASFTLPAAKEANLQAAVLVQDKAHGNIVSAARVRG